MKIVQEQDRQTRDVDDGREPATGEDVRAGAVAESFSPAPSGENDSGRPSALERLWLVAAAALLIAAAVLLLLTHTDAAFVTATLGVCAWFLNVRDRLKREHGLQKRGPRNWEPRGKDAE